MCQLICIRRRCCKHTCRISIVITNINVLDGYTVYTVSDTKITKILKKLKTSYIMSFRLEIFGVSITQAAMLIEIELDPHTVEIIPAAGTHSPFSPISQHASHSLVVSAKAKAKLLTIKRFIVFNCLKIINKNYFSVKILFYMQNFSSESLVPEEMKMM